MQRTDLAFTHVVTGAHEHVTFHTPYLEVSSVHARARAVSSCPSAAPISLKGIFVGCCFEIRQPFSRFEQFKKKNITCPGKPL